MDRERKKKHNGHRGKNQWVLPVGDRWAVRGEGNTRNTRITDTQQEAIDIATRIARNQRAAIIVQTRHGRLRARDAYGNELSLSSVRSDSAFSTSLERSLQENRDVWEELAKH